MQLHESTDPETFAARAGGFLAAREAENNLFFGILHGLRTSPSLYPDGFWLATVEVEGEVVGAALQTPPNNVVVTRMPERAVASIVEARPRAPGFIGPEATVAAVMRAASRRATIPMRQRIYECAAVEPVPAAQGTARVAGDADDELVLEWRRAFGEELREPGSGPSAVSRYRALRASGNVWLWDDAGPAAMALVTGPTPSGIRVGGVYTPPERRRRGYATSLVAEVTSHQLAAGRRFCFLFTDLANPTSNAIYQRIGYRPVCDMLDCRFE